MDFDMTQLLDAILDTLIPPSEDGRMPGAGSLGIAKALRAQIANYDEVVNTGLEALRSARFIELDIEGRSEVLRGLEVSQPQFIASLYPPACTIYYQHPDVWVGLGLEPRPPHPKGYELEAGDLSALDRVRARGKLYRDA
jgi:hypothetical protein